MPNQTSSNNGTTITITVPPTTLGNNSVYVATTFGGQSSPISFNITAQAQPTTPKLTFTVDPSSPVAQNIAPNSAGVTFTTVNIVASGVAGSISAISVGSDGTNGQANLSNIRIYQGTTLLGSVGSLSNLTSVNGFAQYWGSVSINNLLAIPVNFSGVTIRIVADVSPSATGSTKLGIIGLGFGSSTLPSTNLTTSFMAFGNPMTFAASQSQGSTLNAPTLLQSASPVSQFVAGGSVNLPVVARLSRN